MKTSTPPSAVESHPCSLVAPTSPRREPAGPTRRAARPRLLSSLPAALLILSATPAALAGGGCPADLSGDGTIDGADLGALLADFGGSGPADLDGSGVVDGGDLGILLAEWGVRCPTARLVATELAGKPLVEYPNFDYTLAFYSGSTVSLLVDPALHPDAIGIEVDVYVTADRTAAEWDLDPSLTDVRAGGSQTTTFPGGALASNVLVLDAGTLDGNGGLLLGVGYDVVVDVDRSGTLNPGDLVDGYGDGAGFAVVRDPALAGPYATTFSNYSVTGVTAGFGAERAYYPTNIASLGALPLVVISHGNGHQYTWYDWLGNHLASFGMVVMSHQNNTGPGIETASTTTLQHTQSFIGQQGTIAGGVLNGHIDADRIVWIGHSRGGEGVARAYDRIFDGTFTPSNYSLGDIKLISSIAPTDFLGTTSANPHAVPYHLLYGSADGDVCGCPDSDIADSFNLYERAAGFRASTYVQGADHNDFNCCGVNDFSGPSGTQIGRPEAQDVAKSAYLALIQHVLNGSEVGYDLLKRHYEDLRPPAVLATTVVVNDLRSDPADIDYVVDDFQTNTATNVSSSGGAVVGSVLNLVEGKSNDSNTTFTWSAADVMNGLVRGRTTDLERNAVFDYDQAAFLEFELPEAGQDVSGFEWLSFRAAQGPRHPRTTAVLGNQTFLVTLRDGAGVTRSVNLASYGIGIQEPYQRTGFGTGAGWQSEMELVRIRLTDFVAGGGGPDLSDIVAIRFDFAAPGTTSQGRITLDDLRFTQR